jgi:hypothetical protein
MIERRIKRGWWVFSWWQTEIVRFDLAQELREAGLI